MLVRDVLKYDDIMRDLIDNSQLNAKIKFRFLNMRKQFEPIVQNFQSVREEILKKHSETKEDGTMGIFAPERDKFESEEAYNEAVTSFEKTVEAFNKDIDPILNDEAKIEITKFKADEMMDAGISSDALLVMYDLIEE